MRPGRPKMSQRTVSATISKIRRLMNSMYFTEEHDFFRKSFSDFLKKEVVPHIEKWEETGHIERFIFFQMKSSETIYIVHGSPATLVGFKWERRKEVIHRKFHG